VPGCASRAPSGLGRCLRKSVEAPVRHGKVVLDSPIGSAFEALKHVADSRRLPCRKSDGTAACSH
jgi:hypothetical protein